MLPNYEPAFRCLDEHGAMHASHGMTLRDYFAAKAIPSIISECKGDTRRPTERPTDYFARIAYEVADAMIAAREDNP